MHYLVFAIVLEIEREKKTPKITLSYNLNPLLITGLFFATANYPEQQVFKREFVDDNT